MVGPLRLVAAVSFQRKERALLLRCSKRTCGQRRGSLAAGCACFCFQQRKEGPFCSIVQSEHEGIRVGFPQLIAAVFFAGKAGTLPLQCSEQP